MQDDDQLSAMKRSFERKFLNLEAIMNKKLFKNLQALATDTRTRLTAFQVENKVKLNQVQL